MLTWWTEFAQRPPVAHLLRAGERFTVRGGPQLAAAISFFSVLSMVPILMLGFSALGLTVTVLRPEAMVWIEQTIQSNIDASSTLGASLYTVIYQALTNWASILGVGLFVVIWVGSGWVGNLKRAVRLLMREDVDRPEKQLPLPLDVLANFAGLVGLLLAVAATFGAATVSTSLGGTVGDWLGIGGSAGWSLLLRGASLVVALVAGAAMFRGLFGWFSPQPLPRRRAWVSASIGSLGLLTLQVLAGYLISAFSGNAGTAVFGSTIVVMLFLNLFATLLLYIAAWLATDAAAAPEPEPAPVPATPEQVESLPGELYVSSEVARRSLGIGLGTGYVVGAATGLGIGAAIASVLGKLFGRRA